MARSFGSLDIIQLPRLSAAGAIALVQQLITVAETEKQLPAPLPRRLEALKAANAELHTALGDQPPVRGDTRRARLADEAEDAALAGLFNWLLGWTRVDIAESAEARRVQAALFPEGLKFTQLPYKLEWAETDARLARLGRDGLDAVVRKLGGGPILDRLRAVHEEYGNALGITDVPPEAAAPVTVRDPLDTTLAALRSYVLATAALADDPDSPAAVQAEALLQPLRAWQSRASRGDDPAQPEPAAAGSVATTLPGQIPVAQG